MTDGQVQLVRAGTFASALAIALLLQRLSPHARLRGSWSVNGALWLVDAIIVGALCGACAFSAARWAAARHLGLLHWMGTRAWPTVPATVLALDLVSYGWHRANHRVPVLWRFHQVHHSDPTFTVSTGLRFHPGELVLSLPVRIAAVVAIGASAAGVILFEALFTLANLVEHGDIAVARRIEDGLGRFLVTPALHRRHHTKVGPARDSNYGTIFSFWDRAFASHTPNDSASAVETGLPGLDRVPLGVALLLPLRRKTVYWPTDWR